MKYSMIVLVALVAYSCKSTPVAVPVVDAGKPAAVVSAAPPVVVPEAVISAAPSEAAPAPSAAVSAAPSEAVVPASAAPSAH